MKNSSIDNLVELKNDSRKIIAFCGAGGKTSSIHAIRDYYLKRNKKVLVTTTTHMFLEEGCVSDIEEIIKKLDRENYAFAGIPMNSENKIEGCINESSLRKDSKAGDSIRQRLSCNGKISSLPDDDRELAQAYADVTLIEADGARCLPFKVPKPWEPVIPKETTDVVLVMGMDAEGKRICETCFNPEGVAAALEVSVQTTLTRELMLEAYMKTYVPLIRERFPAARVFIFMNEKVPGKTIIEEGLIAL